MKFHPEYDKKDAERRAKDFLKSMKGIKDKGSGKYFSGLSSSAFNKMSEIMDKKEPRIPILNSSPSEAIYAQNNGKGTTPSLLNCSIQGAASSFGFLSSWLVATTWLNKYYNLDSRFLVACHDEANFLYKKEDRFKGAYAVQIAHLWTWSLMHYTSGIYEIPLGTAFASAINIDRVWRKSAKSNTVTCSNHHRVPNGVELSMGEILEKI